MTPRVALLAALGTVIYGGALAIAATSDTGATSEVVSAFAAGFSFSATGIVAVARRPENRTGLLMLAAGFMWALGALTLTDSSVLFTIGAACQQLAFVPLAQLLLAYPSGVLERRYERRLIATLWVVAFTGPFLLTLVDRTPTGCATCPESAIAVWPSRSAAVVIAIGYGIAALTVVVAIVVELVRKYRAAGPPLRRAITPVYATFATAVLFLVASNALEAVSSQAATTLSVIGVIFIALVPVAFLAGLLRIRLARGHVLQLLLALEGGTPLRDALSDALGDPSLEIAYRLSGSASWIDAQGRPVPEPARRERRAVTTVERHGERIAALVHDSSLDEEPDLVRGVAAAAALALQAQRAQAELRNQLNLLTTLVDATPSLLITIDLEGQIMTYNDAALHVLGADGDQIRGRCFWDVFADPDDRVALRQRFFGAAPEHAGGEYENAFTNLRGQRRVIFWRGAPVRDDQGRAVGVVAGGLDVTERLLREEAVRKAEERFRAVVEHAPVAIMEIDLDDRVRLWNPAAERIFGWSADDVLGRPPVWVPEDLQGDFRALSDREALGESYTGYETIRVRRDGRRIDVEIAAAPIRDADGEIVGAMAVITDISERRHQEEEVRASRARIVQAADEARRRLERNLHDGAQQRLVALSVALRLAESKVDVDPSAAAAILADARAELALALEELRELARGIHPAVLTDRGLAAAVDALVARCPVPVEVELADVALPPTVEAALYYVAAESLTNVAKYAGATSASLRVGLTHGRAVVLEVRDDGIGGADPARGSGLRGLGDRVAALDGRLAIESPPGGGTCVTVEIPLGDASAVVPQHVR